MRLACLLVLAAASAPTALLAQGAPHHQAASVSFGYATTRTNSNAGQCGCFWLNGGAGELAVPLGRRLSAIVDLGGGTTSSINGSAQGLSLITYTAGPRFTLARRRYRPFAQALAGGVHGFNSFFPVSLGAGSANAFAMLAGGGFDLRLSPHTTFRMAQAEYLMSRLPNGSTNYQNNLRLSSGIVITFRSEKL